MAASTDLTAGARTRACVGAGHAGRAARLAAEFGAAPWEPMGTRVAAEIRARQEPYEP